MVLERLLGNTRGLKRHNYCRPRYGYASDLSQSKDKSKDSCSGEQRKNWNIVYADIPIIMCHEIIGWIARDGDIALRRWGVKEGDRVIVEGFIRCFL